MLKLFNIPIVLWGILLFQACELAPTEVSNGSGSDVEVFTALVKGSVVDSTGSAVSNATVRLRSRDFLANATPLSQLTQAVTEGDTTTDDSGGFCFSSVDTGMYTIEVLSGETLGVAINFNLVKGDSLKELPLDTLLPLAKVTGEIEIQEDDTTATGIQIFGLERYAHPDTNGQFCVTVPRGHHRFRIAKDSAGYEDMHISLELPPGVHNDMGRIRMKPSPCHDYHCDSTVIQGFLDKMGLNIPVDSITVIRENRIVELNMRGLGLAFPPFMVTRLTKLQVIDLGANNLSRIKGLEHGLEELRVLKLDSNQLTKLDKQFGTSLYLDVLDLSRNALYSLPFSIINLTPDSLLDLSGNKLCNLDLAIINWADEYDPDWKSSQQCE